MPRVLMVGADLEQRGGIATLERLLVDTAPAGIDIVHVASHDEGTVRHRVWVFARAWVIVTWRLLTRRVDLVHVHHSGGGSLVRKAIIVCTAHVLRCPVVLHGNAADADSTFDRLPMPLKSFVRSTFVSAEVTIAATTTWAEWYEATLGTTADRVVVLVNPASPPVPPLPPPDPPPPIRVVALGRLGPRKGTEQLVVGFATALADRPGSMELVVGGDGEVAATLRLVADLGVGEFVSVPGWLEPAERDDALARSHALALFSHAEGFPLAIVEALVRGIPVLCSPVSGIDDLIVDGVNGLLAPPGDTARIAEVFARVVDEEGLLDRLARGARSTGSELTIQSYWPRLLGVYETALGHGGRVGRGRRSARRRRSSHAKLE